MKAVLAMMLGAALYSNQALAQDGELPMEVRCLMANVLMLQSDVAPELKSTLTTMSLYYFGRIEVRDPTLDVSGAMIRSRAYIEALGVQAVFDTCAAGFEKKMKVFAGVTSIAAQ